MKKRKKKFKILFTDLTYLKNNYGAQGIAFPLMVKLSEHFDADYTFAIKESFYKDNAPFARKHGFSLVASPDLPSVLRFWLPPLY